MADLTTPGQVTMVTDADLGAQLIQAYLSGNGAEVERVMAMIAETKRTIQAWPAAQRPGDVNHRTDAAVAP